MLLVHKGILRTAGFAALALIPGIEPFGVGGAVLSTWFAEEDYKTAVARNNADLRQATLKCLGDNPNASRSAKNRAINEANTNTGGTPMPYIS